MKILKALLFFALLWICLSWLFDDYFIISSCIFSIVASSLIALHLGCLPNIKIRILGFKYVLNLLWNIFLSSWYMTKSIWIDGGSFSPMIKKIHVNGLAKKRSVSLAMYADSITATPGTIVIGIDGDEILTYASFAKDLDYMPNKVTDDIINKIEK